MVLNEPGRPLRAADRPVPEPGDGEVLVKAAACGVCRTDLPLSEANEALSRLRVGEVTGALVLVP